jgi:hypothetical protein
MLALLFFIEGHPNAGAEYHWLCATPAASPSPAAAMGQPAPTA